MYRHCVTVTHVLRTQTHTARRSVHSYICIYTWLIDWNASRILSGIFVCVRMPAHSESAWNWNWWGLPEEVDKDSTAAATENTQRNWMNRYLMLLRLPTATAVESAVDSWTISWMRAQVFRLGQERHAGRRKERNRVLKNFSHTRPLAHLMCAQHAVQQQQQQQLAKRFNSHASRVHA